MGCGSYRRAAAVLQLLFLCAWSPLLVAQQEAFHSVGTTYPDGFLSTRGRSACIPGLGDEMFSMVLTLREDGHVDSRMLRWCEMLDIDIDRGWFYVEGVIDDRRFLVSYRAHSSSDSSSEGLYLVDDEGAQLIQGAVESRFVIESVNLSGDGNHVVYTCHDVLNENYQVYHCDLRTMVSKELYRQNVNSPLLELSHNGDVLLYYGYRSYWTYTISTGQTSNKWFVTDSEELSDRLAFSPDGTSAWGAAYRRVNNTMRMVITRYDVKSGARTDHAVVPLPMPQQSSGNHVHSSPDGKKLAIELPGADSMAFLDIASKTFTIHRLDKGMIRWIGWMSDSRHFCYVSWDETCIADAEGEQPVKVIASYLDPTLIVADPSGTHLSLLRDQYGSGSTIDLTTQELVKTDIWNSSSKYYSDYTRELFIAKRSTGDVQPLYRTNITGTTTEELGTVPTSFGRIIGADASGNRLMFLKEPEQIITFFDRAEQRVLLQVTAIGENDYRSGVGQITADGRTGIFVGYYASRIWDLDQGSELPFPAHYDLESYNTPCLPVSPDGRYVVNTMGKSAPFTVFDRTTQTETTVAFDHRGFIDYSSFSGDGNYFIVIGFYGTVGVYSTATWSLLDHFELGNCSEEVGDMRNTYVSWHPETGVYAFLPMYQHNVRVMRRTPTGITESASENAASNMISVSTKGTTVTIPSHSVNVCSVTGYTLLGSAVDITWSSSTTSEILIDPSPLERGIYLLQIEDEARNRRVVKLMVE